GLCRDAGGGDPAEFVGGGLRDADVPVGAGRDARGVAAGRGDGELREDPSGADPADLVAVVLREPQVPVGAGRDAEGVAVGRGDRELPTSPARLGRGGSHPLEEEPSKKEKWEQSNGTHHPSFERRRYSP